MFGPKDLSHQIAATYKMLRIGAAVIAFSFPVILWIGGYLWAGLPLEGSMSAYYHAGDGAMRNVFVGMLFALGMALFVYQGFTTLEDLALDIAALLACGLALCPSAAVNAPPTVASRLHGIFAIFFFVCIAYVCIFRASDTLSLIKNAQKRTAYARTYKVLGVLMVAFPVAAFVFLSLLQWNRSVIFFVEGAGVYAFASYWVVKSWEMSETSADRRAACGELKVEHHGLTDAFRSLQLEAK